MPTLLDYAPITWRHPGQQAIWRLAAASLQGFRGALDVQDFTEVHTPKLVAGSTESGANVFTVDYFGRPAYLAQSPQFYKQMMVGVFERVYEVGPVFRAEPHDTVRHLAEYVSLDAELGFIQDHRDVLGVLRDVLAAMVESVRSTAADAVECCGATVPDVPETIPVIHFRDALHLVGADPRRARPSPGA
ncbi:MAG: amino acid--tRNA ligase-related protein [Nocardioidaceae bacterium]